MAAKRKPKTPAQRGRARAKGTTWYPAFLAVIADSMNVRVACDAARVDSTTVYDRRKSDLVFAAAWEAAMKEACDKAEAELYRRAVEGVEKPTTVAGAAVIVTEYSDSLLTFLLRAHRPEKYRETTRTELSGPDGEGIKIRVVYDDKK